MSSSDPTLPLAIVVGAGARGHQIAARLGQQWRVHLLDVDPPSPSDSDERLNELLVEQIRGDGTSRVVLERAGASEAAALLAIIGDDQANLECARLARELFGVQRVLAVFHDSAMATEALKHGIEPIDAVASLVAIALGRLDPTIRHASGVGLGKGEIVEVTLLGSSPVIGRPLKLLGARDWVVAAVYREEALLVPHGDTVLHRGDRVVLVGDPSVLPSIAEFFRAGSSTFPMPYGRRLGVVSTGDTMQTFWDEIDYLRENTHAAGVDVFSPNQPPERAGQRWYETPDDDVIERALIQPGVGCLILSPVDANRWINVWSRRSGLRVALARARQPVLVARGTFPYHRLLLTALDQATTKVAAEVAVGLAGLFHASILGVTAAPPAFVVGARAVAEQVDALGETAVLAQVHRVPLTARHLSGNPIRRIVHTAKEDVDLLVGGYQPARGWAFWNVDVTGEIFARARCSVLAVPLLSER